MVPTEEAKREDELSKPTGAGKAKKGKKTRRGKRGGVRRRMQMQRRLFLETIIQEKLRDIRYSMEAVQTCPSDDVKVDGISMNLAEMSIDSSDAKRLYDYEHFFPEQLNKVQVNTTRQNVDNGDAIQNQQTGYAIGHYCDHNEYVGDTGHNEYGHRGYAESTGYAGYDHVAYGYGYEHTGYAYGSDYGYAGYGYYNSFGYAHA